MSNAAQTQNRPDLMTLLVWAAAKALRAAILFGVLYWRFL